MIYFLKVIIITSLFRINGPVTGLSPDKYKLSPQYIILIASSSQAAGDGFDPRKWHQHFLLMVWTVCCLKTFLQRASDGVDTGWGNVDGSSEYDFS